MEAEVAQDGPFPDRPKSQGSLDPGSPVRPRSRRGLRAWLIALSLTLGTVATLSGQYEKEPNPPSMNEGPLVLIETDPPPNPDGEYRGGSQTSEIRLHIAACDYNYRINLGSLAITWNNVAVAAPDTTISHSNDCPGTQHRAKFKVVTVPMNLGSNFLKLHVCDVGQMGGACTDMTREFTYRLTSDIPTAVLQFRWLDARTTWADVPFGEHVVSGADVGFLIRFRDEAMSTATRTVTLNGVTAALTHRTTDGTSAVAEGTLQLNPGANTIVARICSASGTCAERDVTVGSDRVGPVITISPNHGHRATVADTKLSINWSDAGTGVDAATSYVTFNDVRLAVLDTPRVRLVPGENVIRLHACDRRRGPGLPNCTTKSAVYYHTTGERVAPIVKLTPHAEVLRPPTFDATLAYSTVPYLSHDQERSATLVYRSSQAAPMGMVQVDVEETSAQPPVALSIGLVDRFGAWVPLTSGGTENFYTSGPGTNRLAAQFDAAHLATGAYAHTAVVRSWWSDGSMLETRTPVMVLVRNERDSPFGAGWTLQGFQRIVPTGTSDLVLADGDGSLLLFRGTGCVATSTTQTCSFDAPAGESSTLVRYHEPVNGTYYVRGYQDRNHTVFDGSGTIRYHKSAQGPEHTYLMAGRSTPASMVPPGGRAITFNYHGTTGKLVSIQDGNGRTTSTTVDRHGTLTTILDPDYQPGLRVSYDTLTKRALQAIPRNGGTSDFAYDRGGELHSHLGDRFYTETSSARWATLYRSLSSMVLPAAGRGTSLTLLASRVRPVNLWLKVTPPAAADSSTFRVDRFGLATATRDSEGRITRIFRDEHGRDTLVAAPEDTARTRWADWRIVERVQNGVSNTYEYHPQFRTQTAVRADNVLLGRAWYNTRALPDSTWSGLGKKKTRFTYDAIGRPLRIWNDHGDDLRYTYEPGGTTSYTLNTQSVTQNGVTTTFTRDEHGRIIRAMNMNQFGHSVQIRWNKLNQVVQVTGPLGDSVQTTSTLTLATLRDANGQLHQFQRNWAGLDTARIDPRAQRTRLTYDNRGRLASLTNRRGQVTRYEYDAKGRPLSVRASDGSYLEYAYDDATRMFAIRTPHTADTLRYSEQGLLEEEVSVRGGRRYSFSRWLDFEHVPITPDGALSWPAIVEHHSGGTTLYTSAGWIENRARSTLGSSGTDVLDMGFDDQGRLTEGGPLIFGPGASHVRDPWIKVEYDRFGPAMMSYPKFPGMTTRYDRDDLGRIVKRTSANGDSAVFRYDDAGQLREYGRTVNGAFAWRPAYRFDAGGNVTDWRSVVEAGNRLTAYDGWQLQYDADGNLIRRYKEGVKDQTLTWNAFGQLTSVTTAGSGTVSFIYDGLGRRVRKTGPAGSLDYLYDGTTLIAEANAETGATVAQYQYLPGVDRPYKMIRDGKHYRYVIDHQGSVVGLAHRDTLVNQYQYDPWGRAEKAIETVQNPLRYVGRELDSETGLYYVRARYYDPAMGRFISEDPIGLAGGLNLYAYAQNSPMNHRDPTGLCATGQPTWKVYPSQYDQLSEEDQEWLLNSTCVVFMLEGLVVEAKAQDKGCTVVNAANASWCTGGDREDRYDFSNAELWDRGEPVTFPERAERIAEESRAQASRERLCYRLQLSTLGTGISETFLIAGGTGTLASKTLPQMVPIVRTYIVGRAVDGGLDELSGLGNWYDGLPGAKFVRTSDAMHDACEAAFPGFTQRERDRLYQMTGRVY